MATQELSEQRKEELVKFFSVMTSLDKVTARRWLEKSEWKVDEASKRLDAERYEHNEVKSNIEASNPSASPGTKTGELKNNKAAKMLLLPHGSSQVSYKLNLDNNPRRSLAATHASSSFSGRGHVVGGEVEYERWLKVQQNANGQCSVSVEDQSGVKPNHESRFEDFDPEKSKSILLLRLPDGSRLEVTFNLSHTVGDIRKHIALWRPNIRPYFQLLSTASHPPKKLTDDAVTLEAAGLLNAALIVRYR